jgi:putative glutamine amidotransferase
MSTTAPAIGITTYGDTTEGAFSLPPGYVHAVRRAGGLPLLIAPGETRWETLFAHLDGLILAGGGDICPSRYGGAGHETIYNLDAVRDESELQLARQALDRRIPILAICRGLQLLNVALGGSLHAHVPDVFGEDTLHRAPPRQPTTHAVHVSAPSSLHRVLQCETFACRSWHHQAVDRLGEGCRVVAQASDGVVEALELADHPQVLAVQWHPELSADAEPLQQRLFDQLVSWARERREGSCV